MVPTKVLFAREEQLFKDTNTIKDTRHGEAEGKGTPNKSG